MDLDDLDNLFDDLAIDGPTPKQLFALYGIFLQDIVQNPLIINGIEVKYNNAKSKHPVCRGKAQTFEHIITRGSKYNNKRYFDPQRANKIHWIRPIIENVNDWRVKYFERVNDEGFNQLYFWYAEKSFIIIIRIINPDYMLITSFEVDHSEKRMYKAWYEEFKK